MRRDDYLARARKFRSSADFESWQMGLTVVPQQSATVPMRTGDPNRQPGPQASHFQQREYTVRFSVFRPTGNLTTYVGPPVTPQGGASGGPLATPPAPVLPGTPFAQGFYFSAVAYIITQVDGVPITRKINVIDGTSISGVGQNVAVYLQDTTVLDSDTDDNNFGQNYSIRVQIAEGPRASYDLPPTLIGIANEDTTQSGAAITLTAGVAAHYPIPANVGVISVKVEAIDDPNPNFDPNIRVDIVSGGNVTSFKSFNPQISGSGFVNIPPNANEVIVTNKNPPDGDNIDVTVTFGVEG